MMVEIKGIKIHNKGAELMLVAIREQMLARYPDAKFVVEPHTDFIDRSRYLLYQKVWLKILGIQIGLFADLIPKRIRNTFGMVTDSEIDVILDSSGFAYGDQWGPEKANSRLAKDLPRWNKRGVKVVLLPQAFGPFENPALQIHMKKIQEHADLIFARDDISFGFMQALGGKNVHQSCDFTNLVSGEVPESFQATPKDVCVIPNSKMIEMTGAETGEKYPKQMAQVIEYCQKNGLNPYILVHEGKKDDDLAKQINDALSTKVEMHRYESPEEIKGVIGTAHIVISSRFHGLVSALSQGVPAVATGWSHKYEMLMQDYGCESLLLTSDKEDIIECLKPLLEQQQYDQMQKEIQTRSAALKQQSKKMWEQVFTVIGK